MMPRNYARLIDSDSFFEVPESFLHEKSAGDLRDEVAAAASGVSERPQQQQKSIRDHIYHRPSTGIGIVNPSSCLQEQQNIENGNPNIRLSDHHRSVPPQSAVASQASTASGASLQEQGAGAGVDAGARALGPSGSSRWIGRKSEDRYSSSDRSRAGGGGGESGGGGGGERGFETFRRGNANSGGLASSHESASVAPFQLQRSTSLRERETTTTPMQPQVHQEACAAAASTKNWNSKPPQDKNHPCTLYPLCNEVREAHRSTKNSSQRERESSGFAIVGGSEKKPLAAGMQSHTADNAYAGSFTGSSHEGGAAVQRSFSTRELKPGPELTIENWASQPATRSARQAGPGHCLEGRHRVSFSLVETHDLDPQIQQHQPPHPHPQQHQQHQQQQKYREKWREPIPQTKKVLSSKCSHPDQHLRYNYEQPGFVERETDMSGKPYTIYGVKGSKEASKSSHGRPPKLMRAFSHREQQQNSNYTRISRALSVNGAGNVLPVDCVTCGQGIGIVVLGFPGHEASTCQSCKPPGGHHRGGWNCPGDIDKKKKKGVMEYCRKLLRLPRKVT